MKEKLQNLETLLNEINDTIEKQLRIEELSIDEFTNRVLDLEEEYIKYAQPEKVESFKSINFSEDLINDFISKKNDRSFFETELPKLKTILNNALALIDNKKALIEETRFGSRLGPSNETFKKLLFQKILTTETVISLSFDHQIYEGYLAENGYFYLHCNNNSKKPFSSFSTAASFVCKKPIQKGWEMWYAKDQNGNEHSLDYFRNTIVE